MSKDGFNPIYDFYDAERTVPRFYLDIDALIEEAKRVDVERHEPFRDVIRKSVDLIGLRPVTTLLGHQGAGLIRRYATGEGSPHWMFRAIILKDLIKGLSMSGLEPRTDDDRAYEADMTERAKAPRTTYW